MYWCATGVDKDHNVVHGLWDACGEDCPLEEDDNTGDKAKYYLILDKIMLQGCRTTQDKDCIFPFKFQGRFYKSCTRDYSENRAPWCATKVCW